MVAELIADGLTNQSIATRLAVAPRTAEAHVENIRRKLGVRSRAQIAAWVTEHRIGVERLGGSPDVGP
jgi:DNA-binding NarL/FixJ family response regulator